MLSEDLVNKLKEEESTRIKRKWSKEEVDELKQLITNGITEKTIQKNLSSFIFGKRPWSTIKTRLYKAVQESREKAFFPLEK